MHTVPHRTTVVLVVISLMLVLRAITWEDVLAEREAWSVLIYFTMVLTLAHARTGFDRSGTACPFAAIENHSSAAG